MFEEFLFLEHRCRAYILTQGTIMEADVAVEEKLAFFFGLFYGSLFSVGIWFALYMMYRWMA